MWLYAGVAYPVVASGKLFGEHDDVVLVKTCKAGPLWTTFWTVQAWVKESAGQLVCPD